MSDLPIAPSSTLTGTLRYPMDSETLVDLRKWIIYRLIDKDVLDEGLIPLASQIVDFIKDGIVPEPPDDEFRTEAFEGESP